MESHGVAYVTRRDLVREKMRAMQALWSEERAAFSGAHVRFEESWSWPKPVQKPRPPVLLGGAPGPTLFAHIAEYCDGWVPIGGAGVAASLPALHAVAETYGRDPRSISVVPFGTLPSRGKLDHYVSLGITEVVVRLPSAPRDDVLRALDEYAVWIE